MELKLRAAIHRIFIWRMNCASRKAPCQAQTIAGLPLDAVRRSRVGLLLLTIGKYGSGPEPGNRSVFRPALREAAVCVLSLSPL